MFTRSFGWTILNRHTCAGGLVDDSAPRAFAASHALLGAERAGDGAVGWTGRSTGGEELANYWAVCKISKDSS